jgi:hypothetical protein
MDRALGVRVVCTPGLQPANPACTTTQPTTTPRARDTSSPPPQAGGRTCLGGPGCPCCSGNDTYVAPPPRPLGPAATPTQIAQAYKASAARDLVKPGVLNEINGTVQKYGTDKAPVTARDIQQTVANADVKVMSEADYVTLKTALNGQRTNPATALTSSERAKIPELGVDNLARARLTAKGETRDPNAGELAQAKSDLMRVDPGAFQKPPKDAVYVNQRLAGQGAGDPNLTKVADHEFVHLVLDKKGVPHNDGQNHDPHHYTTGVLGWNAVPGTSGFPSLPGGGETRNWRTPPGQGVEGRI